jgi:hypothetical protein
MLMKRKSRRLDLNIEDILHKLLVGEISTRTAKRMLSALNIERISDMARLDVRRSHRIGAPEAILAEGKDPEITAKAAVTMARKSGYALVTRIRKGHLEKIRSSLPRDFELEHNSKARTVVIKRKGHIFPRIGRIGVLAAGTADIPVAEEAAVAAEVMGCEVLKAYDVGIAGIHRLFGPLREMTERGVSALVVVAGMEGALPSVASSLVDVPVIGVPTSVGYGVGAEGVGALVTMLQTCSPKLAVVNIDNGFGAGIFAALIARQTSVSSKKTKHVNKF